MRAENHKSKLLISSLRGALSPELADSIAQNPKILHGDPVEQIVTIMFVDIVGFSLTTERLTAKESFQQLKAQISYIVEQIHSFGGLVDKSLGDGVLAFFGYHYEKSNRLTGHPASFLAPATRSIPCELASTQRPSISAILVPKAASTLP
jgi:class 3 adenylate cyclase